MSPQTLHSAIRCLKNNRKYYTIYVLRRLVYEMHFNINNKNAFFKMGHYYEETFSKNPEKSVIQYSWNSYSVQ